MGGRYFRRRLDARGRKEPFPQPQPPQATSSSATLPLPLTLSLSACLAENPGFGIPFTLFENRKAGSHRFHGGKSAVSTALFTSRIGTPIITPALNTASTDKSPAIIRDQFAAIIGAYKVGSP